ncbi:putative Thioredoxin reductase 3-like protein [Naja naja]|nr:putative Thioredoxin reductase 3-like protein [Naja naja]
MPPPGQVRLPDLDAVRLRVRSLISTHWVMIFSKSYCPFCRKVKDLFHTLGVEYSALELDKIDDGPSIQEVLLELTSQRTVPNVFINGNHIGGCDQTFQVYHNGTLQKLLGNGKCEEMESYDYDLIIIGGGSGGLACSKEAATLGKKVMVLDYVVPTPLGTTWAKLLCQMSSQMYFFEKTIGQHISILLPECMLCTLGKKVMVLDYVVPTPLGTTWGLGGTCVNVGCIPKKLMHQAALLGQALQDSRRFGWEYDQQEVRVAINRKGQETFYTAETFVIATGERPRYLGIPGDKEYCITSDDLFSLPYCPGRTLVVGASYVALECAGFLASLGLDVTVMVRSILLRGFDQEMAEKAGAYMETHGVKFIRKFVPIEASILQCKIIKLEDGMPGKLKVIAKSTEGSQLIEGEYNTVLIAVGRDACTRTIGLDKIGVKMNENNGKIPVNDEEQTNVPYVYAIGDILEGKLELTPVAIQAGKLLARRLFGGSSVKCDYINVPTTVFTPLEYGCCGFPEEKAIELFGQENIEVYHTYFWPLEWTVPSRDNNTCYAKIICNKLNDNRVIGLHVLGPNAGEITQGFGAAMKCGITKELLDETIGIHPTSAEIFTTMEITKSSGKDISQSGC